MKLFRVISADLRHYRAANMAIAAAVAVCAAVLLGGLLIGDSVSYSLGRIARLRLGQTSQALYKPHGYFSDSLAQRLSDSLNTTAAAVLCLAGPASTPDDKNFIPNINIYGIDDNFYKLALSDIPLTRPGPGEIIINQRAAEKLHVKAGDSLIITLPKPAALPEQNALGSQSKRIRLNVAIAGSAGDEEMGRFNLHANQSMPINGFVDRVWLEEKVNIPGRVNLCLLGETKNDNANAALEKSIALADLGLKISAENNIFRLTCESVFLNEHIADKIVALYPDAAAIVTYFVNEMCKDGLSCPYSMVTALNTSKVLPNLIPVDLPHDQIIITDWLADDINARSGDKVTIKYYVLTDELALRETERLFTVAKIIPLTTAGLNFSLMPDFPGLKDVENCRDWDSPVPVDLSLIRDKDEKYWNDYQGTPKALVNLAAGKEMWAGPYGSLTEIRIPAEKIDRETLSQNIIQNIDPASAGLRFNDVKAIAQKAAAGSTDFAQLFLGLSMFLIFSAIILIALTFILSIEKRVEQLGILKALGYTNWSIAFLFLTEVFILAFVGSGVGIIIGIVYTKILICSLTAGWQDALAGIDLHFAISFSSVGITFATVIIISWGVSTLALRKILGNSAVSLLNRQIQWQYFLSSGPNKETHRSHRMVIGVVFVISTAIIYLGQAQMIPTTAAFFAGGALLLLSLIFMVLDLLDNSTHCRHFQLRNSFTLAVKNSALRLGRSLSVIALIAVGTFTIVAVSANRLGPPADPHSRNSGTGGFALWGSSSLPVRHNLNTSAGRGQLGFSDNELVGFEFINFREYQGDQADCLNLNRPQRPTILGVDYERLAKLQAFAFNFPAANSINPWQLLQDDNPDDNIIPAIADYATVHWSLHKNIGDTVEYHNHSGRPLKLKIVATLSGSVFQGALIISQRSFVRCFPDMAGFRTFLIDIDNPSPEKIRQMSSLLDSRLRDYGFVSQRTSARLGEFQSVQNTYLTIFQMLGTLGMILGTIGLAVIVIRNVCDRRGEFALLWALGFTNRQLINIIFLENLILLICGCVIGLISALVAVYPALAQSGSGIPSMALTITLLTIILSGTLWTRLAAWWTLKSNPLDNLRNE